MFPPKQAAHTDGYVRCYRSGDLELEVVHKEDLEANTVALVNFLERCPVDHLVYVSSGAVYDGLIGRVSPA